MKMNVLFTVVIIAFFLPIGDARIPSLKTSFFDQIIDHFNFESYGEQTYKQRYLFTGQYWKKGSPLLFYTGNEGDIHEFADNTGLVFEFARNLSAFVVFAEHRYYGSSLPFGNSSFFPEKLGLLTIEQAMADYAYLIKYIWKDVIGERAPVICFGGSYGGMLSAYMRFKYPNLVLGAVAASAPIYSVANKVPQDYFFKDVAKDFEEVNATCVSLIKTAFDSIDKMVDEGEKGLKMISDAFKLCKPMVAANEVYQLYGWIRSALTSISMFDYPYPTNFSGYLPANPVNESCHIMSLVSDPVLALAAVNGLVYNSTGTKQCSDMYSDYTPCADPTGCGNLVAWDYQACTEVVPPDGTGSNSTMFPDLPLTPATRATYCQEKYNVTPRTDWLATNMWGKDLNQVTNIVFTNGDLDPWRRGGLTEPVGSVEYYLIEGGAHHLDLRGSHPDDPKSVVDVRQKELAAIKRWLKEYRRKSEKGARSSTVV